MTKKITVGGVAVGGGAPVTIQSMCNTKTEDVGATVAQIKALEAAGCEIVRVTVPTMEAAAAVSAIREQIAIPLVADIHFDYRLAVEAAVRGADKIRINPGNIGGEDNVKAVVKTCKERKVPIRIGVNGGSLEKPLLAKYGKVTPEALVESALGHIALLEKFDFTDICVSVKSSDVPLNMAAYRLLHERIDYPLHLGVTEAGTFLPGTVRNSVALGILLSEGIGDTVRVSLTAEPEKEVRVGCEILRSLGLRAPGPAITSCPTCGRTKVDLFRIAGEIENALESYASSLNRSIGQSVNRSIPHVAVMGCVVNGPGEAKGADIALCGGDGEFMLFVKGKAVGKVSEAEAVKKVMEYVVSL